MIPRHLAAVCTACLPACLASRDAGRPRSSAGGPPAVGVVKVQKQPVTESSEFVGRVQAIDRVDLVARVTAFIEERRFTEGAEVQQGDMLYRLERGPFEADVAAKQAAVAQTQALLRNASIVLSRAQSLLSTPAGQRSTVDDAIAQQASQQAQLLSAQAQLRASQINLDYTEIRAPIAGKIGRTAFTVGNVVSPSAGPLATIVSQDPMYVLFPVSVRAALDLRNRYADKGGFAAVAVKLRLPDGEAVRPDRQARLHRPFGVHQHRHVDPARRASQSAAARAPRRATPAVASWWMASSSPSRVEGIEPVEALAIPRAAVLSDQQGNYVYVVTADNKAERRARHRSASRPPAPPWCWAA